jgi:hypothetical protein
MVPGEFARSEMSNFLNAGVGLVHYIGHGFEDTWVAPPFSVNNINDLTNGSKTPVVFSLGCNTGNFGWGEDCLAEAFQKKSGGGAVGVVAPSWYADSGFVERLFHGIYTGFWPSYDPTSPASIYPHSYRPAENLNYGKFYL